MDKLEVSITMPAATAQAILQVLAERPFREVADTISLIQSQAQAQVDAVMRQQGQGSAVETPT